MQSCINKTFPPYSVSHAGPALAGVDCALPSPFSSANIRYLRSLHPLFFVDRRLRALHTKKAIGTRRTRSRESFSFRLRRGPRASSNQLFLIAAPIKRQEAGSVPGTAEAARGGQSGNQIPSRNSHGCTLIQLRPATRAGNDGKTKYRVATIAESNSWQENKKSTLFVFKFFREPNQKLFLRRKGKAEQRKEKKRTRLSCGALGQHLHRCQSRQ